MATLFFHLLLVSLAAAAEPEAKSTIIFPQTFPLPIVSSEDDLPRWQRDATILAGQLIQAFLGSFIADQSGLDHPAPDESPTDIFAVRLGQSPIKVMLQGAGNLRALNMYNGAQGDYLFTVLQGGFGAEYDIVVPDGTNHSTRVAVRFSPLYGEIAMIRTPQQLTTNLPPEGFFLGSALGIEFSKRFGDVEPGLRAYVRSEWQHLDPQDPALSYYAAIYCRFYLDKMFSDDSKPGAGRFVLMPIISYYDRGDARDDMYSWNRAQMYGSTRDLADLRKLWEGQIKLEIKF